MERCARECLLRFDSGLQQYNNGSGVVVVFQSVSCACPGRASGRGWNSWILKNVTFTLDTDPPPSAPLPVCACCGPRSLGPRSLGPRSLGSSSLGPCSRSPCSLDRRSHGARSIKPAQPSCFACMLACSAHAHSGHARSAQARSSHAHKSHTRSAYARMPHTHKAHTRERRTRAHGWLTLAQLS